MIQLTDVFRKNISAKEAPVQRNSKSNFQLSCFRRMKYYDEVIPNKKLVRHRNVENTAKASGFLTRSKTYNQLDVYVIKSDLTIQKNLGSNISKFRNNKLVEFPDDLNKSFLNGMLVENSNLGDQTVPLNQIEEEEELLSFYEDETEEPIPMKKIKASQKHFKQIKKPKHQPYPQPSKYAVHETPSWLPNNYSNHSNLSNSSKLKLPESPCIYGNRQDKKFCIPETPYFPPTTPKIDLANKSFPRQTQFPMILETPRFKIHDNLKETNRFLVPETPLFTETRK